MTSYCGLEIAILLNKTKTDTFLENDFLEESKWKYDYLILFTVLCDAGVHLLNFIHRSHFSNRFQSPGTCSSEENYSYCFACSNN